MGSHPQGYAPQLEDDDDDTENGDDNGDDFDNDGNVKAVTIIVSMGAPTSPVVHPGF